jgi:hypothetical protein
VKPLFDFRRLAAVVSSFNSWAEGSHACNN